jgi:hypothetical protein
MYNADVGRMKRVKQPVVPRRDWLLEPYLQAWLALTPAERLHRAWRLRLRLRDPQAVHDEKSIPKL